jgi:GxxExxY protein
MDMEKSDLGKIPHLSLSDLIVGSAMAVLNQLRPGLSEKAYENALAIELMHRGCRVDQQRRFEVRYRGIVVDTLVPDLIVNDAVVVDPKIAEEFSPTHISQMLGYLAVTRLQLAVLLNFKHSDLRWRRIVAKTSSSTGSD